MNNMKKQVLIVIEQEQYDWLKKNHFSISSLVRELLNQKMEVTETMQRDVRYEKRKIQNSF